MFESRRVGAYIALLRRQRGLTQNQLAEKLAVSHQAVSNWERGQTLPDIALLVQLASTLQVSTDQLLLAGTIQEKHKQITTTPTEKAWSELARRNIDQREGARKDDYWIHKQEVEPANQSELSGSVPETDLTSWKKLISLVPFLPKETMDQLITRIEEQEDYEKLEDLAPFLPKETLDRLVHKAVTQGDEAVWEVVEDLAPFLSRPMLNELVESLWKKDERDKTGG